VTGAESYGSQAHAYALAYAHGPGEGRRRTKGGGEEQEEKEGRRGEKEERREERKEGGEEKEEKCAPTCLASCGDAISTSALAPSAVNSVQLGLRGSLRTTTRFTPPNWARAAVMISVLTSVCRCVRRTIRERTASGGSCKAAGMAQGWFTQYVCQVVPQV